MTSRSTYNLGGKLAGGTAARGLAGHRSAGGEQLGFFVCIACLYWVLCLSLFVVLLFITVFKKLLLLYYYYYDILFQ